MTFRQKVAAFCFPSKFTYFCKSLADELAPHNRWVIHHCFWHQFHSDSWFVAWLRLAEGITHHPGSRCKPENENIQHTSPNINTSPRFIPCSTHSLMCPGPDIKGRKLIFQITAGITVYLCFVKYSENQQRLSKMLGFNLKWLTTVWLDHIRL